MALKLNFASSVYGFQIIDVTTEVFLSVWLKFGVLFWDFWEQKRRTIQEDMSYLYGNSSIKNGLSLRRTQSCMLSLRQNQLWQPSPRVLCIMGMVSGQSDDHGKLSVSHMMDKARTMWDSSPQPIKSFPWNKALENFIQLILDLFINVIKYLSIPLFAISSISEMSYCAHERKLFLVPFTLLIGSIVAGVLRDAALKTSPYLKTHHAAVPWHLISMLTFFVLLKCPGPYYPYWGRIFIPHLANGVLLRTLWFVFLWYWRPKKSPESTPPDSTVADP
ncbi:hypothetical protein F511_10282 [Dorcoceras hygrometricum]|uniref:Uncharacterized protein n=1 Tax=Dorcoceras hygrometricum TaxID=472368 RepID=A0A2Z7C9Y6_9LAMI|nr:hypothetical protein F511_10282 [Dorcoceras hygrometricum]